MAKFAKKNKEVGKGHLVVDLGDPDAPDFMKRKPAPKMAVVGDNDAKVSSKKLIEKSGLKEKGAKKETKITDKKSKKEPSSRASDTRKIKVLNKNHGAREGTKRAAWFDALVSSKTVEQAQTKVEGLDTSVLNYAVKVGVISLS